MEAAPHKGLTSDVKSTVDLDIVLEHQQRITDTRQAIDTLSHAIKAQDEEIKKATASVPHFFDRTSQRENLMAEIALGEASEKDLLKLDERIAKDKAAFEDAKNAVTPALEKAKAIRSGLERKLKEAEGVLQQLESNSRKIVQSFLIRESEMTALEYIAHAQAIKMNNLRLRALDKLIVAQGGRSIGSYSNDRLYIPVFSLPQFDGLAAPEVAGMGCFYSAHWDLVNNVFLEFAEYEKERFEGLGVQF
ncbi:hypothetical protein GALL_26160 [mine drainage metagenome]|uniref:Uncharacterized protein n=1 Tax=mine drainage metagenome TaxID=410659 RepID=A0A1J5TSU1_9ZZZZ